MTGPGRRHGDPAVRGIGLLARGWARTPLWTRLIATVLTLMTAALVITGLAGARLLHGYLLGQVDRQIGATAERLSHAVDRPDFGFATHQDSGRPQLPSVYSISVLAPDGGLITHVPAGTDPTGSTGSGPVVTWMTATVVVAHHDQPFTRPGPGGAWRLVAVPLPLTGNTLVVSTSLAAVSGTVGHLVDIDLAVGAVVLLGLGLAGFTVVRASLRPLDDIEDTAEKIAAGDLSRRVPGQDRRTELGRLRSALNTMLGQIETAFAAQIASEARARGSEDRMRQFVADASHELRTPLTSIRGFAELYRHGGLADPDELPRVFRRIEDEAARMGVLVSDLLLLARLDEHRPLERRPVDLVRIVADAAQDAQLLAPDRVVRTACLGTGPAAVIVSGDESRLRQVVSNLVTNAITHTPPGTPIEIRVGRVVGPGGPEAVLEVADQGPGLAPEHARRVFERFYRADPGRSREHGGTGLGLAIVASIVAAHSGRAEVVTSPGRGAAFRVVLPVTAPGEEPGGRTHSNPTAGLQVPPTSVP
ncbi:MAG: sensor histidine kinase [Actinomycetes bacterium]